jgi:hypothetical protein
VAGAYSSANKTTCNVQKSVSAPHRVRSGSRFESSSGHPASMCQPDQRVKRERMERGPAFVCNRDGSANYKKETDTKESERGRENPRRTDAFEEENSVTWFHDPYRPEGSARAHTHTLSLSLPTVDM